MKEKNLIKPADRDFRILQLTDLHIGASLLSRRADKAVHAAVRQLVSDSTPDLIVVTGDAFYLFPIFGGRNNMRACKQFCALMEEFALPWAFTFGNHETDVFTKYGKADIAKYIAAQLNCLYIDGCETAHGWGNYHLPVYNSDGSVNQLLFFFDSHQKLPGINFHRYDHIRDCQVAWYEKTLLKEQATAGKSIPSLAFFHIPFMEFMDSYYYLQKPLKQIKGLKIVKKQGGSLKFVSIRGGRQALMHYGEIGEPFSVPVERGLLFEKLVEHKSTKAVFCGHDHVNSLSMSYYGIRLVYGLSLDHIAYMRPGKSYNTRGGTLITLNDKGDYFIKYLHLR